MRPLPKKQISVRNVIIGGEKPLICLPLVGAKKKDLRGGATTLLSLSPDIVEWRVDGFEGVKDIDKCTKILSELRNIFKETPILFTCRSSLEGGARKTQKLTQDHRLALFEEVIVSGLVDLVDIELSNEAFFLEHISNSAHTNNVKVVFSYHNFKETPSKDVLQEILLQAETKGADIAKIAVMPKNHQDVLVLFSATDFARTHLLTIPMITIAMGKEGRISRLAGGLWGSDITFAAWEEVSAPGQLPVTKMRLAMKLIY